MEVNERPASERQVFRRRRDFERDLKVSTAEWFRDRGAIVDTRRPYLLRSPDDWRHNIILPEVAKYIETERASRSGKTPFALHKYAHHGLSSQAFLFNLIGPLIVRSNLEPLALAFAASGLPWPHLQPTIELEHVDRDVFDEKQGQPTSFDLSVHFGAGVPPYFVECKLTEREFGSCSLFTDGDCAGENPAKNHQLCTLHRMGRRYLDLMAKHELMDGPVGDAPTCILSTHYQFYRELLFSLSKGGKMVLLSDERSPTFIDPGGRGRFDFLVRTLPERLRESVAAVSVQTIVAEIEATGRHEWIVEFRRKYGME